VEGRREVKRTKPTKREKKAAVNRGFCAESPLTRIKRAGTLSVYELMAADEIIAANALVMGGSVSRDPDLGIPTDGVRFGAADSSAARQMDLVKVFRSWQNDMIGSTHLQIVKDVLLSEIGLHEIDKRRRWRNGTAKEHMLVALRHFAALRGNTPRSVKDWKYSC
jgi:hypothetical protein